MHLYKKNLLATAVMCALLTSCGGGGGGGESQGAASDTMQHQELYDDPLYKKQWHLSNTGQAGNQSAAAKAGEDINVTPVWENCINGSCKGEGVTIAVVDDGVEIAHADLTQNVSTSLKHRVYSTTSAPADGDPTPTDDYAAHGTAVAGIIAARDNNGIGVRGVAPRASLLGYRLLGASTDTNEADAMSYQAASIAISSNSWGPSDELRTLQDSTALWRSAIDDGLRKGRNGRGTIYVWANGNGGFHVNSAYSDSSNYDGLANYRGVIAVGAVNAQGNKSSYTEPGANVWVSAPGGEDCDTIAITTTDLEGAAGYNRPGVWEDLADVNYSQCMNGTSAATPVVSGVVALMLQANPALTWRDVRDILARTARKNDAGDGSWKMNGAGIKVSDYYGFGVVDAAGAVRAAYSRLTNLPVQKEYSSGLTTVNQPIPDDNPVGITSAITLSGTNISKIEWVDVMFSASDHTYSGDLSIVLVSPSGTRIALSETHWCEYACVAHNSWRFGIAHLLDEPADGTWRLEVKDLMGLYTGTFESWKLNIYGN